MKESLSARFAARCFHVKGRFCAIYIVCGVLNISLWEYF